MKTDSFYLFVIKEISKNSFNRMNLSVFTRVLSKKSQVVSSAQLLFVYKELQKLKTKNSRLHLAGKNISDSSRQFNSNNEMKMQSYEKHTLICLQEIAIKFKEKDGYEEGFDLCKLLYYRLINAIEFNLPHAQILDQFREEFLQKELGQEIIDYVGLIEKDPSNLGSLYIDTVNNIIQTVSEELGVIDVMQLPFLKSVLARGQSFGAYNIDESLLHDLDKLIDRNKYNYSFKELENSLLSDKKHYETYNLYSLFSKDFTQKRLNYMVINENNLLLGENNTQLFEEIKSQIGLPGKKIELQNLGFALKKITQLNLFGVYINLFQSSHQEKQITKTSLLKLYVQYHFKYFLKSCNPNYKIQQINETINNTFESKQKMTQKGLKFQHLEILKLFLLFEILSKEATQPKQMYQSHMRLQKQLATLNLVQKPKIQQLNTIFGKSLSNLRSINKDVPHKAFKTLSKFIKNSDRKVLTELISEDLKTLEQFEKKIVMNELILSLVNALSNKNGYFDVEVIGKMMEIFMKIQFKKFSTEFQNIQKLLNLIKEK